MFGIGPYIESEGGDMHADGMMEKTRLLTLTLNMLAVTRLMFPTCNIAAATALESLVPGGRVLGIGAGCNVVMPNLTPTRARVNYRLYRKKTEAEQEQIPLAVLEKDIESTGRHVAKFRLGSSVHFRARFNLAAD